MALGGGNIRTTTFPGSYISFVSTKTSPNYIFGERGVVAMCYALPTTTKTDVVVCETKEFYNSTNPLGTSYTDDAMWMFRELFKHARKVIVYNLANANASLANGLTALEAYDFNVIVTASTDESEVTAIITRVKSWRDDLGKKCQAVVYNHSVTSDLNNIAVINVAAKPAPVTEVDKGEGETTNDLHTDADLVYWVAGAMAACAVNKSCTNMLYDGDLTIDVAYSQSELQGYLDAGKIIFHLVYGEVRMLEDVNSLVTPGEDQNADFKYNQTIRVIDQIANDIAYLFNTKYLGRIQNNDSGRISLWNDIVSHHKQLETMGAIENFKSDNVTVVEGDNIRSVVVNDIIHVVGTMSQLFMTVVIE